MPATSDLELFRDFVIEQIDSDSLMSPEQCLQAWRNRTLDAKTVEASVAELQLRLVEMERGDHGLPAREFLQSLRRDVESSISP